MVVQMNIECGQDVAMGIVVQSDANNKSLVYVGQDHLNAGHTDGANALPFPFGETQIPGYIRQLLSRSQHRCRAGQTRSTRAEIGRQTSFLIMIR